jgi:hypothetical protein
MSTIVSGAIIIALLGWFATIIAISRSGLTGRRKRMLLIPSWLPWLALALGAPILSGLISWQDAVNLGGAITTGMLVSVVISRGAPRR